MANVTFPRETFEKEVGKIDEKMQHNIAMFGTTIESLTDEEIELEIFPDRPDLLSMQGYLRGLKAFLGKEPGLKTYALKKPEKDYQVTIKPSVKAVRPHAACAIVKNLTFDNESIKTIVDLQEKIHGTVGRNRKKAALGIYPLENIKLPITLEARKPESIVFQPLEGQREMNAGQILQRHPTGRDYAHLLEDYKTYPVFVDAANNILSLTPITNSHTTGKITEETKEVFIECSGHDEEILKKIINIVTTTLADLGGQIYQTTIKHSDKTIVTPDLTPQKNKITLENTNKLLGLDLKEKDLAPLLAKMGHDYQNGTVKSPAWRTDLLHEVDLIEDMAIAYGYDKIIPEIPDISTVGQEDPRAVFHTRLANLLTGLSLTELSTFHLIKLDEAEKMKLKEPIETEESKTDYKLLRSDLLTPTLRILQENKNADYPQNLFEIGTIFSKAAGGGEALQRSKSVAAQQKTSDTKSPYGGGGGIDTSSETGVKETEQLQITLTPGNFTQAKQHLDALMSSLDLHYDLEEALSEHLAPGRAGIIKVDNAEIGHIGETHPAVLKAWGLKFPIASIAINLDELFKIIS